MKQSLLSSWCNVGRTLAMTVGSPSVHRRSAMLKLISVLALILTLSVGQMWGAVAYVPRGTYYAQSSTAISSNGAYILKFTGNYILCNTNAGSNYITQNSYGSDPNSIVISGNADTTYVWNVVDYSSGSFKLRGPNGEAYSNANKTASVVESGSTWTIDNDGYLKTGSFYMKWVSASGFRCYNTTGNKTALNKVYKKAVNAVSNNNNYGTVSVSGDVITATPASGYQISSSTAYTISPANKATVTRNNNTFTLTNISDIVTVTINFEAASVSTPTLTLNGSGAFGNVDVDDTKDLNFTLTGANLTANASVGVTGTGFELITPSNGTLTQTAGSITGSNNITVRFAPTAGGAHNGTLTVSSTGATDASVSLSGTGVLYDHFIDDVQNTTGYTGAGMAKGGDYSEDLPTIADKDAGSGNCQALHYHFCGWVTEANRANPHGHLATINGTATGTTYYAVWSKGSGSGGPNDFTLVESSQDDWSGTYLFVNYSDNDHAMSSDLSSGKFAAVEVEPSNKVITCTNNKLIWTLAKGTGDNASKYSVKSNQTNTYAGIGSGSTTGSLNNDAQWLSLSYDNNHQVKISGSSGRNFSYYSSNTDFRTYSSANGFYLYKKNEVTYSDSISVCCTELGSIKGSFFVSNH